MRRPLAARHIPLLAVLASLAFASPAAALIDPVTDVGETVNGVAGTAQGTLDDVIDQAQGTVDGVVGGTGDPAGAGDAVNGAVDETQQRVDGVRPTPGGGSPPAAAAPGGGQGGAQQGGAPQGSGQTAQGPSGSAPGGGGAGGGGGGDGSGGGGDRERGSGDGARGDGGGGPEERGDRTGGDADGAGGGDSDEGFLTRTVSDIREVIPTPIWVLIAALALLALAFGARSLVLGGRARRLARQREELKRDVGLLQQALLPDVPERVGTLDTSVAYRPADGPAAGGDFYDVFEIARGRVAIIVGDVSGHGHGALSRSASMRYTLRAYVDAGAAPRDALKLAAKSMGDCFEDFTTVVLAIHDPEAATLTYATAGHPAPVLVGGARHDVVTVCASPPVGAGLPTGQRQTTVPFGAGALACFFTDGLIEARNHAGLLGQPRLVKIVEDLGEDVDAQALLDRVLDEADQANDDMAACVIRATEGKSEPVRLEELEVEPSEVAAPAVERFLTACGVAGPEMGKAVTAARMCAIEHGAAVVRVRIGQGAPSVDVGVPDRRRVNVAAVEPADLLAAT